MNFSPPISFIDTIIHIYVYSLRKISGKLFRKIQPKRGSQRQKWNLISLSTMLGSNHLLMNNRDLR